MHKLQSYSGKSQASCKLLVRHRHAAPILGMFIQRGDSLPTFLTTLSKTFLRYIPDTRPSFLEMKAPTLVRGTHMVLVDYPSPLDALNSCAALEVFLTRLYIIIKTESGAAKDVFADKLTACPTLPIFH